MITDPPDAGGRGVEAVVEEVLGRNRKIYVQNQKKARVKAAESIRRSYRQSECKRVMAARRSASTEDVTCVCRADVGAVHPPHTCTSLGQL